MVSSTHSVLPAVNAKLSYDAERDLVPIVIVAKDPLLFVINNDVPAKTLQEFIAVAKAEPGKLNYATPGFGTLGHMVSELLAQRAGIKIQHVPYRGGAPAAQGTMTGQSQLAVLSAQVSIPQIEAGNVRAVAIGSLQRDPKLPNVPTLQEAGFPGWEATQWVGLLAPRGTPDDIVRRLNTLINDAIKKPEIARLIETQGMTPSGGTPEEFQKTIEAEVKQWKDVAQAANIKPE